MEIRLYYTRNANNTINKVLENEIVFQIQFKDIADIINPTVKIKYQGKLQVNYAYIPDFDKYYFITDSEIYPTNIHTLSLQVDVLETYKEDILESKATVSRSNRSNEYFDGGDYRAEERKEHTIYQSDKELEFEDNTILVTIGG